MADEFEMGAADLVANPVQPVLPRLRDSLYYGVQQKPDVEAQIRAYARKLNIPPPAAMGDLDFVRAQGQVETLDPNGMVLGSPRTANWLATPDNAALAHDDVANLSTIENLAAGIGERAAQLGAGLIRGAGTLADKPGDFLESVIPLGVVEFDQQGWRWRASTAADRASPAGNMEQQAEALRGVELGYAPGTTWEEVKQQPLTKVIPFALEQGVISIPDMIAALSSLPVYVGARTGEIGQNRAENDKREDATVGDLMLALPAATASALMERFGAKGILGIDDALKGGLKGVPAAVGKATVKEALTEGSQEFVETLGEAAGTETGIDLGQLADRMAASAVAGAGYGSAMRSVTATTQATVEAYQERKGKAERSQAEVKTVGDMMAAAEGSALRARDPQTFHDFVAEATRDTPVESVYVNAQDLVDTLAQGSPEALQQNAEVMRAMPSIMEQIEEALLGNGLVRIPVSELLAFTPETALAQSLMQNLKVDPQGMSMREAEAFMQDQAAELQAEVTKAIEQGLVADDFQASADRVRAAVTEQLNQVNRFTPDVNESYAQLLGSFYATQAARLGLTPEAVAAQYPVTFQAAGVMGDVFENTSVALNQVPPEVAKNLPYETRLPSDPIFSEAIGGTPGAELTADGLLIELERHQKPEQHGDESARTGVFYLPKGSANSKHYRRPGSHYGGTDKVAGPTLLRAPLFVKGATGGKAPEAAWEAMKGKGSMKELEKAIMHVVGGMSALRKYGGEEEAVYNLLQEQGGNPDAAYQILRTSSQGNQLRYALQEHIIAHAAREAGYDSIVGYSKGKKGAFISEVFDVREAYYPEPGAPFDVDSLHDKFAQSPAHWTYEPGLGFQSTLFATVMEKGQAKASAEQWLAMLQNAPGVKKEELEWIGLPEALTVMGAEGSITREQVLTYIAQNGVRIEEVVLGGAGVNSSEENQAAIRSRAVDLAMEADARDTEGMTDEEIEDNPPWNDPSDFMDEAEQELRDEGALGDPPQYDNYQAIKGGENYREVLLILPKDNMNFSSTNARLKNTFRASMGHWDEDNVLAHTRLADFTTPDGKRVLGVLEIQSDWHQKGRDQGYATPASSEEVARLAARRDQAEADMNAAASAWIPAVEEAVGLLTEYHQVQAGLVADPGPEPQYYGSPEHAAWQDARRAWRLPQIALDELRDRASFLAEYKARDDLVRRMTQADLVLQDKNVWPDDGGLRDRRTELRAQRDEISNLSLRASEARQALARSSGKDGIPDAPFKSTWPALVMKRVIKEAVEGGYDAVAWATGEQQADLYDMRSYIDEINAWPASDMPDEQRIVVTFPGQYGVGRQIFDSGVGELHPDSGELMLTKEQAASVMGGELGGKVYDQTMGARGEVDAAGYYPAPQSALQTFTGADLTVGGEGHKAFYNRNLVNITNDLVKKFGTKVGVLELAAEDAGRQKDAEEALGRAEAAIANWPEREAQLRERGVDDFAIRDTRALMEEARRSALAKIAEVKRQQWGFEITDKMREADKAVQPPLFQGEGQARGAFNPATNTITLLRNADLSTTLHELGHFYLETMARMAAEPTAPQEIRDDWQKASAFIGFGGADPAAWLSIPVDGRREGHELWARGFEAYLREGKAPAAELKGAFQRFKAWLVHVYKSVAQLNVELTDEVRGVFDRMLASEEAIAKAEATRSFAPIFATRPEGMTELEWESYQRLGEEATADAQDQLTSRSIRDMQWLRNTRMRIVRDLTREARDKRKAVKAEIEAEVYAEPVYAAQQFLRRGVLNGEPWEGVHKLSTAEVAAIYEGVAPELQDWRALGFGRYGMLAEDGMNPDQAAELFGFTSGNEMVEALLNAAPAREVIEGRTDQRMLERYGDLADASAIERAADEAIHNDARLRFVATEANALAKAAGKKRVLGEAARDFARDLIGRQKIRDLKPAQYTGAETRAAAASARAAAKGDLVLAATEKRNQMVNAYAARAAYDARTEVEKALRYLARFDSAATRKGLDPDYRDQIDAMLERFDLRKGQSLKAIDKRKSLKAWIEAQQARGLDPIIDESLANEAYRKHYRDLTVDEMRGLVDAVKNIAHLARLKNRLLVAAKGRAFQAVVDEAEAAIRGNAYRTLPDKIEHNRATDRLLSGFANYVVIHRKFASLIREMGGLKNDGGILWRAFIEPMNKANDTEAVMRERATIQLSEVFKSLPGKKGDLRRKLYIPEIGRSLTLEGRLAVALNWGNDLNRARILDGDRWTVDQVNAILRTLTADQLQFVNSMWAYLDSFWPQISAKERRVTGVEPVKVDALPFELTSADGQMVQMRGGYYPIKYDTERSSRSEADEVAETVRAALRGAYTRATTRRGHTKARVDKVERPVRKDLMVPFQHVNQVIHDLAFHEYLIDANRLISAAPIDAAIRDHYGVEVLRTIRKTIDDMAEGDIVAQDSLERVVNHIRTGTTIVGLGWNLTTGLLQPLGLTQSIVRVGPKYMAKAIGKVFTDAASLENTVAAVTAKSDFMRLRAKTMMREINEIQNQIRDDLKPRVWAPVESTFFVLIQKLQLIADVPTWLGAYAKAQDQGVDEATAVALADQAVRDSQGSGQIGDLAQIQRGGVWFKLWTNFYSFFNIGFNQLAESVAETRRVGPERLPLLAADILLVAFLPMVLGELMKVALRGEEWDWEELGPHLVKAQVGFLLGFMVGARELGGIIASDGQFSGAPAALRLLSQDLPRLYQQIQQGELDSTLRKTAINSAGIILHFPAGQINRTLDGFEAMAKGETKNPMALLVGPPKD